MGKNHFTNEQIVQLSKSKYVLKVSSKSIKYTSEFKKLFWVSYKGGKAAREILSDLGINPDIMNKERIFSLTNNLKKQAMRLEGFTDQRTNNSGRPGKKQGSLEERVTAQSLEIKKLNQKIEFLKKTSF